jgi:hypothetical protein
MRTQQATAPPPKEKIHIARGYGCTPEGTIGLWPITPLCGDRNAQGGSFYRGPQSLAYDTVEACGACFSHPDYPLLLLGSLP